MNRYPTTLAQSDEMARTGKPTTTRPSTLRIIGGRWRGRRLTFSPAEGLRPTTDRVRETLFNWLAPAIHGAHCLDLFAGSGALGLEALSRGAAHCDFVDTSRPALSQIENHLQTLGAAGQASCHATRALDFLQGSQTSYDIDFIDPPFGTGLIDPTCAQLASGGALRPACYVYIESAAREPAPVVPLDWRLHREKVAGAVSYRLFEKGG